MEKKHYQAEYEIIREGQDGTYMYILEKGEVNVSKVRSICPRLEVNISFRESRQLIDKTYVTWDLVLYSVSWPSCITVVGRPLSRVKQT